MIRPPLWTAQEIMALTAGDGAGRWLTDGIAIDSREVLPGDLFIALTGSKADGHDHVIDAFARGAVGALVHRAVDGLSTADPRLVWVADTMTALGDLGRAGRDRFRGRMIAVTGSVGKTGTRAVIQAGLETLGHAHGSVRSFNNHIGVPLSLARLPRDAEWAVVELGMNRPDEIAALSGMVRPHVAVITTIGPAHLEALGTVEAIADAKAEVLQGLEPDGICLLGIDHAQADRIAAAAASRGVPLVRVSGTVDNPAADIAPQRVRSFPDGVCLFADILGERLALKLQQQGNHWALNGLLAVTAVKAAGGDLARAAIGMSALPALAGRGRVSRVEAVDGLLTVIDDSYNASPLSMASALQGLKAHSPARGARRVVIMTDMAELGAEAEALHLGLMDAVKAAEVDRALVVGPHSTALMTSAGVVTDSYATVEHLMLSLHRRVRGGDVVLVKGANHSGLNRVVKALLGLKMDFRPGALAPAGRTIGRSVYRPEGGRDVL